MAPKASFRQLREYLVRAWRQFSWTDLRWSHLTIVGIIVGAVLINLVLPNGWTVWPLVPVASAMVIVNEAADRNGQGVPPLQVYGFVALVLVVWSIGVVILSKVHFLIQLLGFLTLGYFSVQGYLKGRRREQLIAERRAAGCCIHCGEEVDPYDTFCGECGLEPDPGRTEQQRLAAIVRHGRSDGHARSVLKQESHAASAQRKEQALLARAPHRQGRGRKR